MKFAFFLKKNLKAKPSPDTKPNVDMEDNKNSFASYNDAMKIWGRISVNLYEISQSLAN